VRKRLRAKSQASGCGSIWSYRSEKPPVQPELSCKASTQQNRKLGTGPQQPVAEAMAVQEPDAAVPESIY
jgi:hypothetical protein